MNALFRNIISGKTDNTLLQLFRYTFVGGLAFVVDFGLLYVLTEFAHFHYLLSATVSFVAGLAVNYLLSKLWVFRQSTFSDKKVEFILFAVIGVVGLLLNNGCLLLLSDVFGVWYMFSKMISTVITYFWNFFARKLLLFNPSR